MAREYDADKEQSGQRTKKTGSMGFAGILENPEFIKRSQKITRQVEREDQRRETLLKTLKPGDRISAFNKLKGTVVKVEEKGFWVEYEEKGKIWTHPGDVKRRLPSFRRPKFSMGKGG